MIENKIKLSMDIQLNKALFLKRCRDRLGDLYRISSEEREREREHNGCLSVSMDTGSVLRHHHANA